MSARRFAITASDRYIGVFKAFIENGWEPVKLFSTPANDHLTCSKLIFELAQSHKIPIQVSRMVDRDLADLQLLDCELLVIASYPWRIGRWERFLRRAINFHPAPLPNYRGPLPLVQAILEQQSQWGTSCHKVDANFDTGDILAARSFDISPNECFESLDLKAQMETRQLALAVAQDLDHLWDEATPQGVGRYVSYWKDADRELDFNGNVSQIDIKLRAFGSIECTATINELKYYVRRAVCWLAAHNHAPGTLVHADGARYVLACSDGFVALLEWTLIGPGIRIDSRPGRV